MSVTVVVEPAQVNAEPTILPSEALRDRVLPIDAGGLVVAMSAPPNDLETAPWNSVDVSRAGYSGASRGWRCCAAAMSWSARQFALPGRSPESVAAPGCDVASVGGTLAADMGRLRIDEVRLARMVTAMLGVVSGRSDRRTWIGGRVRRGSPVPWAVGP